jgi:cbb3-type cytochrome oxidase maturation protein
MNFILWLELVVGIIISFTLLSIFIWGAKQNQFDDGKRMMNGLLNDSVDDLQDAIKKDKKIKKMKANHKK